MVAIVMMQHVYVQTSHSYYHTKVLHENAALW